jgi:uncharacterized repeat protein (TIGR03803 family)
MRGKRSWFTVGAFLTLVAWFPLLTPASCAAGKYKVLHRFTGADGATPSEGLIFDAAGNLYGTTAYGGNPVCYNGIAFPVGYGTVFKLVPNPDGSWTESVLHEFTGADGQMPEGALASDATGNLYGTTSVGGAFPCPAYGNCGTVFKMSPNPDGSWSETVLHSFGGADGWYPGRDLVLDKAGNLYGTTSLGGAYSCSNYSCGTVFKMNPNPDGSWSETVLHSFNGADGELPTAGLIFDAAGSLYGTTEGGGPGPKNGYGTVFVLKPNSNGSWTESLLYVFTGSRDGNQPSAGLVMDAVGNLYGTTPLGGAVNNCYGYCGLVFKLAPKSDGSWKERVLHMFAGRPAGNPVTSLIFDVAGNIYGTAAGPTYGGVFKMTPSSKGRWVYSILQAFDGKPGSAPFGPLVLDKAGNLYGTTSYCGPGEGCDGIVFEITP